MTEIWHALASPFARRWKIDHDATDAVWTMVLPPSEGKRPQKRILVGIAIVFGVAALAYTAGSLHDILSALFNSGSAD